jgi:hypothetical protein
MSQTNAAHIAHHTASSINAYAKDLVEKLKRSPIDPSVQRVFELTVVKPQQSIKKLEGGDFAGGLTLEFKKVVASGKNQSAAIRKAFQGELDWAASPGMSGGDAWEIYVQEIDVQRSGLLVSQQNIGMKSRDPFALALMKWTNVFVRRSRLMDGLGATLIDWFDDKVRYGVGFGVKRLKCVDQGDFRVSEYLSRLRLCHLPPSSFAGSVDSVLGAAWSNPADDAELDARCGRRIRERESSGGRDAWADRGNALDRALSCIGLTHALGLDRESSLAVLFAVFLEIRKAEANGFKLSGYGPLKSYLEGLPCFSGSDVDDANMYSAALMLNYTSSEVAARDYVLALPDIVREQHEYRIKICEQLAIQ